MLGRVVVLVFLLGTASSPADPIGGPDLVAVYPNPIADGDRGEFIVIAVDEPTNLSGYTITDGESSVELPDRTVRGRVVLVTGTVTNRTTPSEMNEIVSATTVVAVAGRLALANAGEEIRLMDGSRTIDSVRYDRAPEGELYVETTAGWRWHTPGATDHPIARDTNVPVRAFVLPDAPGAPIAVLESARERILLAGYSFTSQRVARTLCRASDRGVDVHVLLDAAPVGGLTRREARLLDTLVGCTVDVNVLGGSHARYAFHHAKYAVVDDRALVLSENWKPSGTGGRSSRGWGVVIDSPTIVTSLVETFRADADWRDVRHWDRFRVGRTFSRAETPPADGRYPTRFRPAWLHAARVEVLVAPDNAEPGIVALLDGANESIRITQVSVGGRRQPFLRASVRAARRGVHVRLLLSSAWYVHDQNRALVAWVNSLARREGLPIEARLAEPRSRFEKLHVKGLIVDGDRTVVGSLNWNNHSSRENREVIVVLHGEEPGEYYGRVFRADWRGGAWRLPVGTAVVVTGAAVVSGYTVFRRLRFEW